MYQFDLEDSVGQLINETAAAAKEEHAEFYDKLFVHASTAKASKPSGK